MAFRSEAQRRWFFANQGSSGGKSKDKSKRDSSSSSKEYKPGRDPVKTLIKQDNKAMEKAVETGNKEIAKEKKDYARIKKEHKKTKVIGDSQTKFTKNGKYTSKRIEIHNRLIEKINNQNALPNKGEKPKVIFIGGLSASGKSTAVAKLIDRKEGVEDHKAYHKFVYINSDNFKTWLPEYNGYNAGFLHEESSDIFEKAIKKYRKEGKQVIIDATLKNTKNANKKIKAFDKAGYETILYGTNIPGEKSIERATARFKRSKRYVPLKIIKKNAEPTSKSVLKLRHKTDKYAVFDTDVKKGEPVKLIESNASLKQDREQDALVIVKTEKEWRDIGVDKSDLKGYDTKKHEKVRVRI